MDRKHQDRLNFIYDPETNTYTTSARTRSESLTAGTSGTVPNRDVQKPDIPFPHRKPLDILPADPVEPKQPVQVVDPPNPTNPIPPVVDPPPAEAEPPAPIAEPVTEPVEEPCKLTINYHSWMVCG